MGYIPYGTYICQTAYPVVILTLNLHFILHSFFVCYTDTAPKVYAWFRASVKTPDSVPLRFGTTSRDRHREVRWLASRSILR